MLGRSLPEDLPLLYVFQTRFRNVVRIDYASSNALAPSALTSPTVRLLLSPGLLSVSIELHRFRSRCTELPEEVGKRKERRSIPPRGIIPLRANFIPRCCREFLLGSTWNGRQ